MKTLVIGLLPSFVIGAVLLTFVSWAVVGVSQVRGPSMMPTYHDGQIVWIDRWAYGLPDPIIGGYCWFWKAPQVGDTVVLRNPSDGQWIVKRVAGVSGMSVTVQEHHLILGKRSVPLNPAEEYWLRSVSKVPAGEVFVLGDNSSESQDSRDWGFVDQKQVIGRLWN